MAESAVPQLEQVRASAAAHSSQNRAPCGLSCWHRGHFIAEPPRPGVGQGDSSPAVRARQCGCALPKPIPGSLPAAQWIRTLPIGDHGITAPTLWARLGDAPGRWQSFRHLQAQAGTVPVTIRSGKHQVVRFRFACDKSLRYIIDHVAFLSLRWSTWAHAYYAGPRARGHSYRQALRALSAKWLKIIFVMWERQIPYDEQYHLAMMARQQVRQRQEKVA